MHTLPQLPYDYAALEPSIDAATMEIHHLKHHQAYIDKLNAAITGKANLEAMSLEDLVKGVNSLSDDVKMAVRNHAGGHFNHSLFWLMMKPAGGGEPTGNLATAIATTFTDFVTFRQKFTEAAANRFGSGWAWLIVTADKKLAVTSTPNQDNPLMTGVAEIEGTPILGLDVWEHAYYLKYQNRRPEYIEAFWSIINWPQVEDNFKKATS
ncbi:superoxide dismutase [Microgenomates group bacterium RIFCSPHIGHO2_01_FULL_45_11]|nr:MAG: superoxide dismutase [Microgenomates group bacterium RIFCSPHIGHO2_01_FULL_45_11]